MTTTPIKPLANVTVVELARVLACPFADMILAELGATVIKIEQPGGGDETRSFEPQVGDESAYFFACNRGKQSVTANLKTEAGRRIVRDLTVDIPRPRVAAETFGSPRHVELAREIRELLGE